MTWPSSDDGSRRGLVRVALRGDHEMQVLLPDVTAYAAAAANGCIYTLVRDDGTGDYEIVRVPQ